MLNEIFPGDDSWNSSAVIISSRRVHLHAMLSNCGYESRYLPSYDFSGLKRGTSEFGIFQYTIDGEGTLDYEGKTYKMVAGDAMLLHIPHDHRYYLAPGTPLWRHMYFSVVGSEAVRLLREAELSYGPVVRFKPDSNTIRLARDLIIDIREGRARTPFQLSSGIYGFIMSLHDEFSMSNIGNDAPDRSFMRDVLKFCMENLSEDIGVAEMAAASGYSRYHFSRLFHKANGVTPARFLRDLRLKRAVKILQMEHCTVKEISDQCGFADESYFCKVFKKVYGVTPDAFRHAPSDSGQ